MNAMQALNNFWNSFGLPAYDVNTIPDDAVLPYITYEVSKDFFNSIVIRSASLWYRSPLWSAITEKEQQISNFISRGGFFIKCDEGGVWIKRGTPWAQRMSDPSDDMVRRIVLNYELEFII